MEEIPLHLESESLRVHRRAVDNDRLEVWAWSSGHHALHAGRAFASGEVIRAFGARERLESPTRHSVRVGETEHILLDPTFLEYINHSCAPNVNFDVQKRQLIACKPIEKGEELRFFYPSTEWEMAHPFRCHCQTPECVGVVRGAAHLSRFPSGITLSPHIEDLLARQRASAAKNAT